MSSAEPLRGTASSGDLPAVTVLMPAFNAGPMLREAVDSILAQTFTDFEFLVLDDGSTDGTVEALRSMGDSRLRIVSNPCNLGLIATLNRGIELARAPLLARMDADDLAHPQRLQRQVEVLAQRPDLALVGTWARVIDETGRPIGQLSPPHRQEELVLAVLDSSPFVHPSVMARTGVLRHLGGYPTDAPHAEDYALWARLLLSHEAANIPEMLLDYRVHPGQVSQRKMKLQRQTADRVRLAARASFAAAGRTGALLPLTLPGRMDRLRGRPGTLGGDHVHWAGLARRMGRNATAARTALAGLRVAPFSLALLRLLTPPQCSPRFWWRRLLGTVHPADHGRDHG